MASDPPTGQATTGPAPLGWLLVSISTAGAPASLRTQVWRRLRSLGALYLQQSVCLLPDRPEVARAVHRLVDRVHHDGGSARLLRVVLSQPAEEAAVIAEFQAARDAEYAELLERLPELEGELAHERARGRTTYAEVEESEADLERFRSWLAKIAARDYFAAARGPHARAAVERCAQALAEFEAAALATEAPDPPPAPAVHHAPPAGPLRLATPDD
jgi:Protein ChrB, N-terminal